MRAGEPVQQVLPMDQIAFRLERDSPHSTEMAQDAAEAEARRAFDLTRGPLLRAALLHLGAEDHILLLTVHHIVCDGWSLEVLQREIFERYAALLEDPSTPLTKLAFQFRDAFQQRARETGQAETNLKYWADRLAGHQWVETIQPDFPRSAHPGFEGSVLRFQVDLEHWLRLQEVAQSLNAGPFALLLAALNVLLHGWTGQEDFVVATNAAGREDARWQDQVGYYAHTLLERNRVDREEPFASLVRRVGETAVEALGYAVLFDVGFTWYDIEARTDFSRLGRRAYLAVKPWPVDYFPARTDWWFFASPEPEGLTWQLVYNASLFRRETAGALRDFLLAMLDRVAAEPTLRISEIVAAVGMQSDEHFIPLNID